MKRPQRFPKRPRKARPSSHHRTHCTDTQRTTHTPTDNAPHTRPAKRRLGAECSEPVECLSIALEGLDDAERGHGLLLRVFGLGDCVLDDHGEKVLQNTACFFVNESGHALDASATGHAADAGLGDALEIVAQNLAMATRAALAETGRALATA